MPATILVAKYFTAERDAIDALEQQLDEMREEHSGDDGLLAKAVKARLKEIGQNPDDADLVAFPLEARNMCYDKYSADLTDCSCPSLYMYQS
ncbi:MAG: hypothetical protein Q7S71_02285 [Candidatus Nitrotoga sp.]|nr:hypothetical protein [Candidatus Nitrotoga sp.]